MCKLNDDILRCIVDYIPQENLTKINSAHPVFFEVWMKARYASIDITKRDKETKRFLAHLCQPYVAQHVKKFSVRPWLVQPMTRSPRSRIEDLITQFMQALDPHWSQKAAARRLKKRLRKDTTRMTAVFAEMSGIQEYSIDWDESDAFHPEFYRAFLAPPLQKWATHLKVLSIRVPLSMVSSLARLHLPQLESFTYHFFTGSALLNDINDEHDGFIVFVNNLRDSLQTLTLTSTSTSHHLDLSRIFRMMGTFPSLKSVSLSIPFDGGHLSDPMSFAAFLIRHTGSLKEFSLTTSRCATHFKPGDPEHINWIHHIIKAIEKPFPLLSSFGITLRPLKAPLGDLVDFLDMHASTLRSVSLMDRSLSVHEIESLFPYSSDIQELHVKAGALSASFLACIARRFPNLKTLKLECNTIDVDRTCVMDARMNLFWADLYAHRHVLGDWPLQHLAIGILESQGHWLQHIEPDLVHFLPSLTVSLLPL